MIMTKFTIQQLQQMRESEDRVEFKAGEGGNVSYEIAKNTSVDKNDRKDDTANVAVNDTARLSQLTERQRKIYDAIKNVPVNVPVNVPNLASMLGVSEKTIKRDIAVMQSAGLIKRVGSDKTGHWEVIEVQR